MVRVWGCGGGIMIVSSIVVVGGALWCVVIGGGMWEYVVGDGGSV